MKFCIIVVQHKYLHSGHTEYYLYNLLQPNQYPFVIQIFNAFNLVESVCFILFNKELKLEQLAKYKLSS
ncbi:MAG: hypothetical protein KatS3mg027_2456 [Bacteroidia bacterium]|nr:MAG: hypothetical protein KatS3mg027_2456 [Bacteroidia bacterium]